MPEVAIEPIVPPSDSVEEFGSALKAKAEFKPVDLYPRDGSMMLGKIEAKIAHLAGVSEEHLLAYGSGMAAVTDAIDVALQSSEKSERTIACAQQLYSQTNKHVNFWRDMGVSIRYFDSGDQAAVSRALEREPDVLITETVSNYSGVSVLDTEFLLDALRQTGNKTVAVIDNTLPLSTAQPLGESLRQDDPVIAVESGSKSYVFNSGLLGLAYTKNPALLEKLLHCRRRRGSLPSTESQQRINGILPESRAEFDERNLRIFKNTGDIALRLAAELGVDDKFDPESGLTISHPALPLHDNHDFYSEHYPDGATPVFYILSSKFDQFETAKRLWAHPNVKEQAHIIQSFGFDFMSILADENTGAVRIGGGSETDGEALGEAMAEALQTSNLIVR